MCKENQVYRVDSQVTRDKTEEEYQRENSIRSLRNQQHELLAKLSKIQQAIETLERI